jgi:hypothetical protein
MEWQCTFEFAAPIDEAWHAFYETDEPQVRNNQIKRDAYISAGATQVEISEVEAGRSVRWSETEDNDRIEMAVTLEAIEDGTWLTVTRSGFGSGGAWMDTHSARLLGWKDALHDLGVFLESGLMMRRIHEWKSAFVVSLTEVPGGLRAGATLAGGFAAQAGLRSGDLVIRIAGCRSSDARTSGSSSGCIVRGCRVDLLRPRR